MADPLHIRTKLRDFAVNALAAAEIFGAPPAARVFASRVWPMNVAELPGACVYCGITEPERSDQATMARALHRATPLVVDIYGRQTGDIDAAMNDLAARVEIVMDQDATLGGLAFNSWLSETTVGLGNLGQGGTEQPCGQARLVYIIETRTARGAPGARA